ncbi:MAG: glycerol-3-phosphate dehydrogenase/oxidase [Leptospiraceae bacterium]|nr:glycerol-3-phosphate dehydrogenase/oxidase [Leptospiraceae bacterium]MCP5498209.1 glycerol-3-phosphate dehydrogenase/oxidase [Leptospiraceae bacterium]
MDSNRIKNEIKNTNFDILIIGGGITGATILWDATLRGLNCILLEKNDYASGTTQATSKLIHGGLRYLKNMEFAMVRESLFERRILATIAPHAVRPMGFLLPVYNYFKDRVIFGVGLTLYDFLSYDRNKNIIDDEQIPRHKYLNKNEAILTEPNLLRQKLKGALLYYDYANLNPERNTTEFILSAKDKGGKAFNYAEVLSIAKADNGYNVKIMDKITQETIELQSKTVVNSAGPWADQIENMVISKRKQNIVRSKGIHIITRKIVNEKAVALIKPDKTHMFIIPWRNKTIIGTTDTIFKDDPDKLQITKDDILELIDSTNQLYHSTKLTLEDVDFFYGGLRPLVGDANEESTYDLSRKNEILQHTEDGFPGFFTALGGKYTTSRGLAEKLVNEVVKVVPGNFKSCSTASVPIQGGNFSDPISLEMDLQRKFPQTSGEKIAILSRRYGSVAEAILNLSGKKYNVSEIQLTEKYYPEEIEYISQKEDIHYLPDLYFRRSGIGTMGLPKETINKEIAEIVASTLNWKEDKIKEDLEAVKERYKIKL